LGPPAGIGFAAQGKEYANDSLGFSAHRPFRIFLSHNYVSPRCPAMAESEAIGRRPGANEITESSRDPPKQGELHEDVEVGLEMIDIDRIESVYK
jgi:hypothetical protein